MNRVIVKSSVFPAGVEVVWEKLQNLSSLQYVAAPFAAFEPADGRNDLIWSCGEIFRFRLRLFGLLSFGIHTIRILRVGYAVVDLETTGLSPATDSIIEIGLVLAGPDGVAQRRWSTLVNPGPGPDGDIEVGPTFVHGLVAADLAGAPRFDDVADLLAQDLDRKTHV